MSIAGAATALRALAFTPKPKAALWPFLMHFEQHVVTRNTTHLWERVEQSTWYSYELEKEMQQHGGENRPE